MKFKELLSGLESKLEDLEAGSGDVLFKAESGITKVEKCIKELQKEVIKKEFKSQSEEIYFFKHVKPQIFSKLIYYVKLFNIESKRPRSSTKSQVKYFNNQIEKLQSYFNDNLEFYNYYRRGATSMDERYFIRGNRDLRLPPDSFHFLIDDKFSTCQDNTVATIMAFDMLIVYLQQEIGKLEINADNTMNKPINEPSKLFWTGSKTELIELIYALQCSNVINSGTVDIKEMASYFEYIFNIDLGNYYHTFIEIRGRKNSKTKFLDKLIELLNQRMEGLDD
ncbi:RteC domain-containing protein [Flagellimonas nanhaiensis]|uniref:Tetracycline regulation of excision, RteC n=1 Tax=Flagellimonas nanhaiensis TaxID=2292706 RepID=A0A371JMY0_9FLAO|nr:RteC domain-containing protein [Allomuricauda nanhaiensis]RDY58592.1 tetracycline regulation of excision, RteC [Allomuricauda nanhaiensis]